MSLQTVGWAALLAASLQGPEPNFTSGDGPARKFGVHEIVLAGDATGANPFDTLATVRFVPPSGPASAKTVHAFHDGGGAWRARVYVTEEGTWTWSSACAKDPGLDRKEGAFSARGSHLRGLLKVHPSNPRQWATDDGKWFLNLNDTAYPLFNGTAGDGQPIPFADFTEYVKDAAAQGITSFRAASIFYIDDDAQAWKKFFFEDAEFSRFRLEHFQRTDARLRWMLDHHPDLYVQFILFPRGSLWGKDEAVWQTFSEAVRERLLRHMVARYAAYPQIFWLVVNDAHYGPEFPRHNAMAREVGKFLKDKDPWGHPVSTGPARNRGFHFADEDWATYLHLEHEHDLGAAECRKYASHPKPVFLGEDRYEHDHGSKRDPAFMRSWQRRLFWAWLLSGGSANYGGRFWTLHPYRQSGTRVAKNPKNGVAFPKGLEGLDSVPHIPKYFAERKIELSRFEPASELVSDTSGGGTGSGAPKAMRSGAEDLLIYHPNAASEGRTADVDRTRKAGLRVDLRPFSSAFEVEWFRPEDGAAQAGDRVKGGAVVDLTSPWVGGDVVVRLKAVR